MVKADRNRVFTISIVIQWCEQDDEEAENNRGRPHCKSAAQDQQRTRAKVRKAERPIGTKRMRTPNTPSRLLSTDKLVLNALHARILHGEAITPPVRLRELMEECSISRRQVQICLRRLSERGMITRITEGVTLGSQEGYRYHVLQNVRGLPRISRGVRWIIIMQLL